MHLKPFIYSADNSNYMPCQTIDQRGQNNQHFSMFVCHNPQPLYFSRIWSENGQIYDLGQAEALSTTFEDPNMFSAIHVQTTSN